MKKYLKNKIWLNIITCIFFTTFCFNTIFNDKKANSDRWNPLIHEWLTNGYLKNGGMWRLTQDPTFLKMVEAGTASLWTDNYDSSREYFYRSNSFIFLLPRFIFQKFLKVEAPNEKQTSLLILVLNQALITFGASLFGYTCCNLLAPSIGLKNGVLCGLLIQLLYSSNPLILNTYYGSVMCFHFLFIIPICIVFLNNFSFKGTKRNLGAISGYFFLLILDIIYGLIFITVIGFILWLRESNGVKRFIEKIYPVVLAAFCVIGIQYLLVAINYSNISFIGSSLMFRTGLDGDKTYYQTFIESLSKMIIFDSQGYASNLHIRILMVAYFLGPFLAIILNRQLKFSKITLFCAATFTSFLLYLCIFSQSFQIHPSYYLGWFLVPGIPALFCIVLQKIGPTTDQKPLLRWRIFFLTIFSLVVVFHGLRSWSAFG